MNKQEFQKGLADLIGQSGARFSEDISDAMCVVTRVEDFDMSSNEVWNLDVNRSYPRYDVVCSKCKEFVVMSNGLYAKKPKPEQVICSRCLFDPK